jgi:hypothetical protein
MKHSEIVKAISYIRPKAVFAMRDLDIEWMDENQTQPTMKEIEAGWVAYQAKELADATTRAEAKAALLERLGLTADEAALLLS